MYGIDVQRVLAGLAAANLPNNSPNPLEDVAAPQPEQIASGNPWTLGIEAGSDDGGNNHCYLSVGGGSVTTTCSPGVYGFQFSVEMHGQLNCQGATYCTNPSGTGATCHGSGSDGVICSATKVGAAAYGGTISLEVWSLPYPGMKLYTEKADWNAGFAPNTVASPGSGGVVPGPNSSKAACGGNVGGHPCNVITGELWYRHTDVALSGPFGLTFKRFYTAQTTFSGDLGNNWRHTYDANLDVSQQGGSGLVTAYDNENTPPTLR